jgi:ArsR family transcriptional regulator, arsenate/arsenite/antimonite-responsive transcriptional repressor
MRELADTFKALSDETRLQIMTLLLDREELCVCDFVGALDLTQSKASRHLRYLYNAGLVEDRREGLWMHYRVSTRLSAEQQLIVAALAEAIGGQRRQELGRSLEDWFRRKAAQAEGDQSGATSGCGPALSATS